MIDMETDFSKDVILSCDGITFDFATHQVFDEKELERSIDKLLILRRQAKDDKVVLMNFALKVDLPIKEEPVTKCYLTTNRGEILTKSLEMDIMSVEAAQKIQNPTNLALFLNFMGSLANEQSEEDIPYEMADYINRFLETEEFKVWEAKEFGQKDDAQE